jgi:hypothetical protein
MEDYQYQSGGNDVFAADNGYLLITQNETGQQFTANVIDFVIDENGNGIVYFDGNMQFELPGESDYNVLEDLFYSEFSVQQM